MASEKIISPGVFTNEIDQTFLPAAVGDIGAAIIGPTLKGPGMIPTVVNSYGDFQATFGDAFTSGSSTLSSSGTGAKKLRYLTDMTAQSYLKHASNATIVRITPGTYGPALGLVVTGSHSGSDMSIPDVGSGMSLAYTDASTEANHSYGSIVLKTLGDGDIMNIGFPSSGGLLADGPAFNGSEYQHTVSDANVTHLSGSVHNLKWEITNVSNQKGTYTLLVRRGNDTSKRKQILETWTGLSNDPNSDNYVEKRIGDSTFELRGSGTANPYIAMTGSYPNSSKYVRVQCIRKTPDYLDENGEVRVGPYSSSLPTQMSGGFDGGAGGYWSIDSIGNVHSNGTLNTGLAGNFFEDITSANVQGLDPGTAANGKTAYEDALNLLSDQDEYDINLIFLPGLCDTLSNHQSIITKALDVCEDRGDCFVVADAAGYNASVTDAETRGNARNSNYGAFYWPWIKTADEISGEIRWVPPTVAMAGVYAFNDKVAHPWFAPAGLNRGGLDTAIMVERKLAHAERDTLYDANVNPIASFPGQGIVAWGQKTLQKKSSALDRINVRRLLIKLKKFIASSSRFLVFEQNTASTRNRFLNIVNPYMEQVQSQSGLNAFRVVMDESNNTPDTIDRNILYGQIFIQPTRTAEFISLDFTVQPTGATFPE